jgi:hypothetical protein
MPKADTKSRKAKGKAEGECEALIPSEASSLPKGDTKSRKSKGQSGRRVGQRPISICGHAQAML